MPDKSPKNYKTEDEIREETRLRRQEEAKAAAARKPKSELEKKLANYWYHYKWYTIAGVAALILFCIFFNDTVLRPKPDITIIMVSEEYYSAAELGTLQSDLEQIAWDRNGDGKVYVLVDFNKLSPDIGEDEVPTEAEYAAQMKFVAVVASGADPLYLVDDAAYNRLMMMGGQTEDGEAVDIFAPETADAGQFGLNGMTFMLRYYSDSKPEYYQYCMELLQALQR